MPTTVVKTIGSGGDYATPALWEAAAPADLVAADQIWEGRILAGNNFSASDAVVELAGSTSDATRYKHLTAAPGASFQDHASAPTNPLFLDNTKGATLTSTGSYGTVGAAVYLNEPYARLTRLQLAATSGSGIRHRAFIAGNNTLVEACIAESYRATSTTGAVRSLGGTIRSTLVVQRGSTAGAIVETAGSGLTTTIDNCTLRALNGCSNAARREYSTLLIRNSALFGATNVHGGSGGSLSASSANNYTDATAITGFTNVAVGSAGFVDANSDFRITSGSVMKDAGATLSSVTTDVMGTARPQGAAYDVGAHELAAADSTAPTLSSPTGTQTGGTTATVGATTNEGNGTLYAVVSTSATAPTAAQVKAGQTHTGAAAPWSGSQAISSTGAKTLNATGLSLSTTYYAHLMHEDAASNQSAVVSSASFTTTSGGSSVQRDFALSYSLRAAVARDFGLSFTLGSLAGVDLSNPTLHALKRNNGTVWVSTAFQLTFIRSDTGALAVRKTVSTDASGVLGVVTDAALVAGVAYDIHIKRTADGAVGVTSATAA